MKATRLAVTSAIMFSIALSIWVVATHYVAKTCDFDKSEHKGAICVDTASELLASPAPYNEEIIIISGEFGFPLEGYYLKDPLNDNSIALVPDAEILSQFKGKCRFIGQLKGRFTYGKSGHFGFWPGSLQVSEILKIDQSNVVDCGANDY